MAYHPHYHLVRFPIGFISDDIPVLCDVDDTLKVLHTTQFGLSIIFISVRATTMAERPLAWNLGEDRGSMRDPRDRSPIIIRQTCSYILPMVFRCAYTTNSNSNP